MKANESKVSKKREDDTIVLVMPEKAKSLKGRIAGRVVEILREEPLLTEQEIITKLIFEDDWIRAYYKMYQEITFIRYVIWSLAKKKIILKAKIQGDDKHVYYFLPEQLDMLRERIVKNPGAG